MKYVVSYQKNPEVCDEVFALWDSTYDVGYDWFDVEEMVDGVSIFDTQDEAEKYAREVLREVFFDELYVVGINDEDEVTYVSTVC